MASYLLNHVVDCILNTLIIFKLSGKNKPKTERPKDRKTLRQKDLKTERPEDRKTLRQKDLKTEIP